MTRLWRKKSCLSKCMKRLRWKRRGFVWYGLKAGQDCFEGRTAEIFQTARSRASSRCGSALCAYTFIIYSIYIVCTYVRSNTDVRRDIPEFSQRQPPNATAECGTAMFPHTHTHTHIHDAYIWKVHQRSSATATSGHSQNIYPLFVLAVFLYWIFSISTRSLQSLRILSRCWCQLEN